MKRVFPFAMLAALAVVPCAAGSAATPASMYGVGPHGFDWVIGKWACVNSIPSNIGGPTATTDTITRSSTGGIFYHSTGVNFDSSWYNVYVPKTKTWLAPFVGADGSYGSESTTMTGKKIVWLGSFVDPASGKSTPIRDTNVNGATTYTDLGEFQIAGAWKTQYKITCTRS
jgi:hypothetical protein